MTTEERKLKKEQLEEHHRPIFDKLGIVKYNFYPKPIYTVAGSNKRVINVYESNLNPKEGFFTEIVDQEYEPIDDKRKLYYYAHNPNFKTELNFIAATSMFQVPVEHLQEINPTIVFESSNKVETVEESYTDKDENFSNMTIRDFAAIIWGKPISNKKYINEMIKNNK